MIGPALSLMTRSLFYSSTCKFAGSSDPFGEPIRAGSTVSEKTVEIRPRLKRTYTKFNNDNQIFVFYGFNSLVYTQLGDITDKISSEMAKLLGRGNVTITSGWAKTTYSFKCPRCIPSGMWRRHFLCPRTGNTFIKI